MPEQCLQGGETWHRVCMLMEVRFYSNHTGTWKSRSSDLCDDKASDSGICVRESEFLYSAASMYSAHRRQFEKIVKTVGRRQQMPKRWG